MKTRLIWEFDVDVKDIDPKFVDLDGLAEDLTKREMQYMIDNHLLTIDNFIYEKGE